ncbi:uncharacterized protein LOC134711247 [Mytilus trossulus]|uniref:uncharacterized protein LOC134711247 n=1 Tax=Mytilus trossulus TaxID=6551 RepID=UPI003004C249
MTGSRVIGAASLPLIGCIALIAAAVCQVIAFACANWGYDKNRSLYVGLWRDGNCFKSDHRECYKRDHVEFFAEDWLKAVRGLECLALIFLSFPLVTLPIYMYIALGLYYRCMLGTMALCSLISAVCCLAGVVVYGVQITSMDWDTSWCLYVAIVGAAGAFIAFLVLIVATITKRPEKVRRVEKVRMYTIYADE